MSEAEVVLIVEDDKKRAEICAFLSRLGVDVDARKSLPKASEAVELRRLKKELARHLRKSRELEEAYTHVLAEAAGIRDPLKLESVRKGALLHDSGKMAIPDSVLKKPGPLTPKEWEVIKRHPALGYGLVRDVKLVREVGDIILCHHERYDGSGYPKGLKGEAIPIEARIFAVADTLDAVTSHRPYRAPRDFKAARLELEAGAGRQFDPKVVDVFRGMDLAVWEKIRFETTRLMPPFDEARFSMSAR
jgi:HD-GYP domain-containing protein (c-di-GMP phosphodiesterase class II)